jgi:hypothetical protein
VQERHFFGEIALAVVEHETWSSIIPIGAHFLRIGVTGQDVESYYLLA